MLEFTSMQFQNVGEKTGFNAMAQRNTVHENKKLQKKNKSLMTQKTIPDGE